MTTMRRQLAELGLAHRFDEMIEEVTRVRSDLGLPIMVTPFPQIVISRRWRTWSAASATPRCPTR